MRIIIVSTIVPFVEGGGTFVVDWLHDALRQYGYKTEVIKIPFHSYPPVVLEQILALRLLDITDYADLVIAIRTPSYLVKHPNKVLWLLHQHKEAYDLWGMPYDIPDTTEGMRIREAIIQTHSRFLKEAKKIFTNSKVVSDQLKKFNGIDSEILYPPLVDNEKYHCKKYEDYFFYPSRITEIKKQYLAIEAMKYTKSEVQLVIAGSPDAKEQIAYVESIVKKNNLRKKVKLMERWISEEEKIDLFASCLGCIYIPHNEDFYEHVLLESYYSRKPVITCSDSVGTLEIVEDGRNGFVVSPEPRAIAEVMDKLYYNRALAKKMGKTGHEKVRAMGITWDGVIKKLVA